VRQFSVFATKGEAPQPSLRSAGGGGGGGCCGGSCGCRH
jgi:hypothetical protein